MQILARGGDDAAQVAANEQYRAATQAAVVARRAARAAVYAPQIAAAKARGETMVAPSDSNFVFPDFLFRELPQPVLGLMLAAIFAAAISSAAGALSSLTSATMIDFYRRWLAPTASEERSLRTSRVVMAVWGILATAAAAWLGGGSVLELVNEFGSFFYGSILGVFVLALIVPRASGVAASAGLVTGLAGTFAVHFTMQIAYLWYNLIGCVFCVGVGWIVSWFAPARQRLG
jgi:Na+/proline symporter